MNGVNSDSTLQRVGNDLQPILVIADQHDFGLVINVVQQACVVLNPCVDKDNGGARWGGTLLGETVLGETLWRDTPCCFTPKGLNVWKRMGGQRLRQISNLSGGIRRHYLGFNRVIQRLHAGGDGGSIKHDTGFKQHGIIGKSARLADGLCQCFAARLQIAAHNTNSLFLRITRLPQVNGLRCQTLGNGVFFIRCS